MSRALDHQELCGATQGGDGLALGVVEQMTRDYLPTTPLVAQAGRRAP